MNREELARRLLSIFREELSDHLRAWHAIVERVRPGEPMAEADLQHLFRIAHSLKGASRTVGLEVVERYCHALEERLEAARGKSAPVDASQQDALVDAARVWTEVSRRLAAGEPVGEDVIEPRAPVHTLPMAEPRVRVAASRLDELLAASGELTRVVARCRDHEQAVAAVRSLLHRSASASPDALDALDDLLARLRADVPELVRLARTLDDRVRAARLVPFGEALEGLAGLVTEVAAAAGKEAELAIEGADVELDRAVAEGLRGALVQLARNAVAHGVEAPGVRRAAGKRARARVVIGARLRAPDVEVWVGDDGRGLDLAALCERARGLGLPEPEPDAERAALVFVPGLSTAEQVDAAAGRGVGLDVAKTDVERLQGRVEVHTEPGRGTRFELVVPLTASRVPALVVRAGGSLFALAAAHVVGLSRSREGLETSVALGELLGMDPSPAGPWAAVVVLEGARGRVGLIADEVVGLEDLIVEGLGARLPRLRYVAGASVVPSGEIVPILNVAELARAALAYASGGEADAEPQRSTILVVDDSLTARVLAKTLLEGAGYRVVLCSDGVAALAALEREPIDLVVADVEMPRLDGLGLLRAIRRGARPALGVILLTTRASEKDREQGLSSGADAYLTKSAFEPAELITTIEALLSRP
ncbi:MAG: response regulator [Sandaracinaceae bacterium]|nr:response regulator [Sandaracinaceae bacterium]